MSGREAKPAGLDLSESSLRPCAASKPDLGDTVGDVKVCHRESAESL